MRNTPLLTAPPTKAVTGFAELYAIALAQAERAATSYDKLATSLTDDGEHQAMGPVRYVLETLHEREQDRIAEMRLRCLATTSKPPSPCSLPWPVEDLVPSEELADLAVSALSTPYQAWAIAVRHRQRVFVFWTYVAAHATRPEIRTASETMAREALADADLLRRERRLAWRALQVSKQVDAERRDFDDMSSAALLESLLLKEIIRWAQGLPPAERERLIQAAGLAINDLAAATAELPGIPEDDPIGDPAARVIRYAEQLTSRYLDESDRATDQDELDLAQDLASSSIGRLARLRAFAITLR